MASTCQNEYGKIELIYLSGVASTWRNQDNVDSQWERLGFLSRPDQDVARTEYLQFERIMSDHCREVRFIHPDSALSLDAIYCRDASIATDHGMIICSMGKENRVPEPAIHLRSFQLDGMGILGEIRAPGTVEGGDVAWVDEHTIAVGHSYRTNPEGIRQMKELLEPHGITVVPVQLPHFRGPDYILHLMSIFSPVDKDLAVVWSHIMPIEFREYLLGKGYTLVEIPEEEFDSQGCNVLALAPRVCLLPDGNPVTRKLLEEQGAEVITFKGNHVSIKGGGGPTCLTRPITREV